VASAFLVSIPWEAYHIMVVPYSTIIELNHKHLRYLRMLRIDCTTKLTVHVILHNLNSSLRALDGGDQWGSPAENTKLKVHF